jgi:hypothetical protein
VERKASEPAHGSASNVRPAGPSCQVPRVGPDHQWPSIRSRSTDKALSMGAASVNPTSAERAGARERSLAWATTSSGPGGAVSNPRQRARQDQSQGAAVFRVREPPPSGTSLDPRGILVRWHGRPIPAGFLREVAVQARLSFSSRPPFPGWWSGPQKHESRTCPRRRAASRVPRWET